MRIMSNNPDQSEAVFIRGAGKPRHNSFDFGPGSPGGAGLVGPGAAGRLGFGRSMSVNSEGASTQDSASSSSPPYSPVDAMLSSSFKAGSKALNIPQDPRGGSGGGGGRFRTSSFSSGYGPNDRDSNNSNYSYQDPDSYLIHSPLSTSAPGMFRRSNSISVGALEYQNSKYSNQDQGYGSYKNGGVGGGAGRGQLGPIDEMSKIGHFGDAFKKSLGSLFSSPSKNLPPKSASPSKDQGGPRKQGQMKDRVVSMLCESAIR